MPLKGTARRRVAMIEPRLASHILVSGLIRQAEAHGGFAAVLRKGDRTAGSDPAVAA